MGPLNFIKKTFTTKRDEQYVWSKDYIEIGYVRFSDSSYGLPVKWIERNCQKLEELVTILFETIDDATAPLQRIVASAVLGVTTQSNAVVSSVDALPLEYKIAVGVLLIVTAVLVYQYFLKGNITFKRRSVILSESALAAHAKDASMQSEAYLSQDQKDAYRLVTSGVTLIKHGRIHTRSIRTVSVSADLKHLTWRNIDDTKNIKSFPLAAVANVELGSHVRIMRAQTGCLMSFIAKSTKDRTLHFEYAQHSDYEENYKAASDWVEALALCVASSDLFERYLAKNDDLLRSPKKTKVTSVLLATPPPSPMRR